MNLENELKNILKIREKMNLDFEISKNSEELDLFLENNENLEELYKMSYSDTEIGIRNYHLNKFLSKDIFEFRDSLIKYPGNFDEFKQIIEKNSPLKYGNIELAPFFTTSKGNNFGFQINTNAIDELGYDEIETRISQVPNNLVGIVNAKIGYHGNKEFYYGNPIIYVENNNSENYELPHSEPDYRNNIK